MSGAEFECRCRCSTGGSATLQVRLRSRRPAGDFITIQICGVSWLVGRLDGWTVGCVFGWCTVAFRGYMLSCFLHGTVQLVVSFYCAILFERRWRHVAIFGWGSRFLSCALVIAHTNLVVLWSQLCTPSNSAGGNAVDQCRNRGPSVENWVISNCGFCAGFGSRSQQRRLIQFQSLLALPRLRSPVAMALPFGATL